MQESTIKTASVPRRTSRPVGEPGTEVRPALGQWHPFERRNLASRLAILRRIAAEYDEMPGLRLTAAQAQRLFWLREDVCLRVLDELVNAGVLRRDGNGVFLRRGVEP